MNIYKITIIYDPAEARRLKARATQTKSAYADSQNLYIVENPKSPQGDFVSVARAFSRRAISTGAYVAYPAHEHIRGHGYSLGGNLALIQYPSLDYFQRKILSMSLADLDEFPVDIAFSSPHFTCLLVCDATHISTQAIAQLAELLLDKGLAYLCAWGPDCERVHDLFDEIDVMREIEQEVEYPIMTTWHSKESLDKALWYLLTCTYPADMYAATCGCSFVITVGNDAWAEHVHRRLNNRQQLIEDVLAEDENENPLH